MASIKQIVCDVCGELVPEDKYKRHVNNGHKDKKEFRCHICLKEFTSNYNLQYHIAHHLNERNFVCNECPRAYNTSADLSQHQRSHEMMKDPYKCDECGMLFQIKSRYNTHMRSHKKYVKGPKQCPVCLKTVLDVRRHHETVHMNVRNHECDMCDKKFNKKSGLERHFLTVHEKQKNFVCDFCNKRFGEKSLLLRHTRRHTAIKTSFYCTLCKKYVSQIKEHYDSVHGDLPYSCEYCYRKYAKRREWNNHIMNRHTKIKKLLCHWCGRGFVEKYQLKRHFRSHINVDGVTEEDVVKAIANVSNFREKGKMFNCKFCSKQFKRKTAIEKHLSSVHKNEMKLNEPAVCDYCGKSYKRIILLERHMLMHVDLKIKIESLDESYDANCGYTSNEEEDDEIIENFEVTEEQEVQIESITIKKEPEFSDDYDDCFNLKSMSVKNEPNSENDWSDNDDNNDDDDEDYFPTIKKEEENEKPIVAVKIDKNEKIETKTQIRCKVCLIMFETKDEFRTHFMTLHASKNEDSLECKECSRSFANKKALVNHFKQKHEKYRCDICDEEVSSKHDLNKHFRHKHIKHQDDSLNFVCSFCGKILMAERNLRQHIQAIHSNSRFECTACEKTFSYKSAMYRHREREHGKGKIYGCEKCPQKVGTKHELALHNERHHNCYRQNTKPEYTCPQCSISFPSSFVLSRHLRRIHGSTMEVDDQRECEICHELLKDFYWKQKHLAQVHLNGKIRMRTCKYCNSEFELYKDFKEHIESHTGVFICTVCGLPFEDLQSLGIHGQTHKKIDSKLRKYICDYCNHRLFTKAQISVHMLKHVKSFDIHYCDVCGKGFKFLSSLYTHRKYHGEGEHQCTYCGRKFVRNSDLVNHIRSHTNERPFKCKVCNKEFAQKQALYYHHQVHPETRAKAKCDECDITFNDKKEQKCHEEQFHPERRPYRCFVCNMTFTAEHTLRRHNKDKHLKRTFD